MSITYTSTTDGIHKFEVNNMGSIVSANISENINYGDTFTIYYAGMRGTKFLKEEVKWLGRNGLQISAITDLTDLLKSIRKSNVYKGEAIKSTRFFNKASKHFCKCKCKTPEIDPSATKVLLGVDLDSHDHGRESSRYIVYVRKCFLCGEDLTWATTIGSYHSTGLNNLKQFAEQEHRSKIDWDNIVTSFKDIENWKAPVISKMINQLICNSGMIV